jgi:cation diffusion facilitator CzcD-associated flavoprotein CzcO
MEPTCCVIGSGIGGLAVAKQLTDVMKVTIFECRDDVGGQWHFTPLTDEDTPDTDLFKQMYGHQQSSIYDDVLLLAPAEVTELEDFPFTYSHSYCGRQEVQRYISEYALHFDLRPLAKFNTAVTLVNPLSQTEFEVTTKDASGEVTTQIFNYVCVASGHNSTTDCR